MSQSHDSRQTGDPGGSPAGPQTPAAGTGEAGAPSLFLQLACAAMIALLAVVAAQSFFTARDVSVVSQNVVTLAARLQAETERSQKLYDEIVILRGQVGDFKNILQITRRQGADGTGGDAPPGPRDWTGIYVSELAPLLPVLSQYEGEMGEAWIYSDNENFLNSVAKALEALQAGGMEVDVEQPSDQPPQ